jgi:hypothetical protein
LQLLRRFYQTASFATCAKLCTFTLSTCVLKQDQSKQVEKGQAFTIFLDNIKNCVDVCVCVCVCVCVYVCMYVCMYVYMCVRACVCVCMRACVIACVRDCVRACVLKCMHIIFPGMYVNLEACENLQPLFTYDPVVITLASKFVDPHGNFVIAFARSGRRPC